MNIIPKPLRHRFSDKLEKNSFKNRFSWAWAWTREINSLLVKMYTLFQTTTCMQQTLQTKNIRVSSLLPRPPRNQNWGSNFPGKRFDTLFKVFLKRGMHEKMPRKEK